MTVYYRDEAAGIVLHHGRCEDVLPTLPAGSIDLVFTSPPYNLGNTTGGACYDGRKTSGMQHGVGKRMGHYPATAGLLGRGGGGKWGQRGPALGYGKHADNMPHGEYVAWQHAILRLLWPLLGDTGAIYYNHKPRILDGVLIAPLDYVPDDLRPYVRQEIIWKRSGGINFSPSHYLPTHERIVVIARRDFRLRSKGASGVGDVWDIVQETNNPHPAPFPLALPLRAMETTPAGTALDPFAGSGTTLVAAKLLGRAAIGIESSEKYCEQSATRLERCQPEGRLAVPLFALTGGD